MSVEKEYCTEEVAKKIAYEFRMFKYLCDRLEPLYLEAGTFIPGNITMCGTGCSSDEERETSASLESFLLHTRVLYDFFQYKRRDNDNVLAGDFVDNWKTPCPSECKYLLAQKGRLNKALAHLIAQEGRLRRYREDVERNGNSFGGRTTYWQVRG